jgi:hypothetical protein
VNFYNPFDFGTLAEFKQNTGPWVYQTKSQTIFRKDAAESWDAPIMGVECPEDSLSLGPAS